MRFVALIAALLALAAACSNGADGGVTATPELEVVSVTFSGGDGRAETLEVEVADTAAARRRGLMLREELAEDRGMLFVFEADTGASFWMRNTPLPLSIAFIAADGTVLDVQDMEPLSDDQHRSPGPYRFALEVNQGWFERHGLGAGDRVEIPDLAIVEVGE